MIEDVDGNRFLDFNAGIAVNATGHCHPDVVAAIEAQARSSSTTARATSTSRSTASCASGWPGWRPIDGAPARVFLTNSGTEAVEGAIKLARYHTGRQHIVAFLGAFHGRTLGIAVAHGEQGEVPGRLRPAAARCAPRALRLAGYSEA